MLWASLCSCATTVKSWTTLFAGFACGAREPRGRDKVASLNRNDFIASSFTARDTCSKFSRPHGRCSCRDCCLALKLPSHHRWQYAGSSSAFVHSLALAPVRLCHMQISPHRRVPGRLSLWRDATPRNEKRWQEGLDRNSCGRHYRVCPDQLLPKRARVVQLRLLGAPAPCRAVDCEGYVRLRLGTKLVERRNHAADRAKLHSPLHTVTHSAVEAKRCEKRQARAP